MSYTYLHKSSCFSSCNDVYLLSTVWKAAELYPSNQCKHKTFLKWTWGWRIITLPKIFYSESLREIIEIRESSAWDPVSSSLYTHSSSQMFCMASMLLHSLKWECYVARLHWNLETISTGLIHKILCKGNAAAEYSVSPVAAWSSTNHNSYYLQLTALLSAGQLPQTGAGPVLKVCFTNEFLLSQMNFWHRWTCQLKTSGMLPASF